MTATPTAALAAFLAAARSGLAAAPADTATAAERAAVLAAWPAPRPARATPLLLPVCDHLARTRPAVVPADVPATIAALLPHLRWSYREALGSRGCHAAAA